MSSKSDYVNVPGLSLRNLDSTSTAFIGVVATISPILGKNWRKQEHMKKNIFKQGRDAHFKFDKITNVVYIYHTRR